MANPAGSERDTETLSLVPTVDILRSLPPDPLRDGVFVVSFAAKTDDAEVNAVRKLADKRLDFNPRHQRRLTCADIGMGSDENEVSVSRRRRAWSRTLRCVPSHSWRSPCSDLIEERAAPRKPVPGAPRQPACQTSPDRDGAEHRGHRLAARPPSQGCRRGARRLSTPDIGAILPKGTYTYAGARPRSSRSPCDGGARVL